MFKDDKLFAINYVNIAFENENIYSYDNEMNYI